MPGQTKAFLDLSSFSFSQVQNLFSKATKVKAGELREQRPFASTGDTIALLFFEPSTRTRMSFETAAHRVGLGPLLLDGGIKSSLEKGESIEDSILNVAAMAPRFLVVRCGDGLDLQAISQIVKPTILNAGWGRRGHPTQALLDAFTMQEHFGALDGKRVLFVGDIKHSRVAASHFQLLPTLQMQTAVCAPAGFLPDAYTGLRFEGLAEGLDWADVVIALRCQFERHETGFDMFAVQEYRESYGINATRMKKFKVNGLIMHPGPINHGIELETEVLADPRSMVLTQVQNGVFLREAILRSYFDGSVDL